VFIYGAIALHSLEALSYFIHLSGEVVRSLLARRNIVEASEKALSG
jgi:hypothetical protein